MNIIVRCIAEVRIELNENREVNERSEYSVEVLRLLK